MLHGKKPINKPKASQPLAKIPALRDQKLAPRQWLKQGKIKGPRVKGQLTQAQHGLLRHSKHGVNRIRSQCEA